jgi:hypothetical protein
LQGKHGADLGTVKDIKQESFNDIVFVMAKSDLITFETMGKMKEVFSPFPGAEETRVFTILSAVRFSPDIGELNMVREPFGFKIFLQDFRSIRIKAKINVNWEEFIASRNSFASFVEEV